MAAAPTIRRARRWPLALAVVAVVALVVASLFAGAYDLFGGERGRDIFAITRIPRTAALVLAGAAMSLAGLVMQLIAQNRFVEPTTTGATEWAGLGLICAFWLLPQPTVMARMIVAVVFAFVGTMVFFLFLRRVSFKSSLIVPIVGIMLGAVVSAISTFIAMQTDMMQQLGIWFSGSFTTVFRGQWEVLLIVLVVLAGVWVFADRLTLAGLGRDVATSVGANYNLLILVGTGLTAIASGVVAVVVGMLPFLGLIVPNIVSIARGDDLRSNLPWVVLLGVGVVTACDLVARTVIAPFEVPVSVVLGVLGAAVFLLLVLRQRRKRG